MEIFLTLIARDHHSTTGPDTGVPSGIQIHLTVQAHDSNYHHPLTLWVVVIRFPTSGSFSFLFVGNSRCQNVPPLTVKFNFGATERHTTIPGCVVVVRLDSVCEREKVARGSAHHEERVLRVELGSATRKMVCCRSVSFTPPHRIFPFKSFSFPLASYLSAYSSLHYRSSSLCSWWRATATITVKKGSFRRRVNEIILLLRYCLLNPPQLQFVPGHELIHPQNWHPPLSLTLWILAGWKRITLCFVPRIMWCEMLPFRVWLDLFPSSF